MRGPKPKPTKLKILAGNPGRRPLPKNEPVFTGKPVMPHWLKPDAVKVWKELVPRYEAKGLVTDGSSEQFAVYCTLNAEFRRAADQMPASRIGRMDAIAQRFAMDPGSATRVQVPKSDAANDDRRFFA